MPVSIAHSDSMIGSKSESKRILFETIVAGIRPIEPIESSMGSAIVKVSLDELEINYDEMKEMSLVVDSAGGSLEICNSIFNDMRS